MDARHIKDPEETINQLQALNRQNRQRVYQLHNLVDISFQLNSFFEEDKIIHTYLLNLFGLLSTKSIVVLTGERANASRFKPFHIQGLHKDMAQQFTISKNDPLVAHLKENRQLIVKHPPFKSGYLEKVQQAGGEVIAPIIYRNILLGLVIAGEKFNGKPYSNWELEIFSLLTNFMAVALSNAKIYKHMEKISLTDPLTGLFNRRYFENFLNRELARARRFNHPLSLVMLDIDHFKNINDRLGHPSGDLLLKKLARLVTRTVRTSDIVARYGGEEFCIILPEITRDGAVKFSERLRDTIKKHPFEHRSVQPEGCITISMGAATFPKDAEKMEELVEKADAALYRAKKGGRNRVVAYTPVTAMN